MILKNYWAHSGYDSEECYFAKVNRELIERIKAKKDESRKTDLVVEPGPLAEVIPFPGAAPQVGFKKVA